MLCLHAPPSCHALGPPLPELCIGKAGGGHEFRLDAEGAECDRTLREAYLSMKQLQLEHHAEAVREGRKPDNALDTSALRPLARANLQAALRVVAAAQSRFPRRAAGWRSL